VINVRISDCCQTLGQLNCARIRAPGISRGISQICHLLISCIGQFRSPISRRVVPQSRKTVNETVAISVDQESTLTPNQHFSANVALRALPWGLDLILFLLIYRYVPNCKTYWRYIWPGALVAAVLFEVAKGLFIWYLDNLASYRQVYGPLTSVMILLLWTYLSSLILILGAEISSEYGRMRRGLERGTLIN